MPPGGVVRLPIAIVLVLNTLALIVIAGVLLVEHLRAFETLRALCGKGV